MRATRPFGISALLLALGCSSPPLAVSQPTGAARLLFGAERVTEAELDFGELFTGERSQQELWLVNDGDAPVHLFFAFQGDRFTFDAPTRVTLDPEQRVNLPIAFEPAAPGSYAGELLVTVTGGDVDRLRVALAGAGKSIPMSDPACLDVSGPVFTGAVATCGPATGSVRIFNVCEDPFSLDGIEIAEGAAAFQLVEPLSLPRLIEASGALDLELAFASETPGPHAGALALTSGAATRSVRFTATATEPAAEHRDVFAALPKPMLDLLIVLDDSPSFASKRPHVEAQLRTFARSLEWTVYQYNVAVTTTSMCADPERCTPGEAHLASGRFLPLDGSGPRVLTDTMPDFEEQLVARAAAIGGGSERERLLRPALVALSEPLQSGHNAGFFRDDA